MIHQTYFSGTFRYRSFQNALGIALIALVGLGVLYCVHLIPGLCKFGAMTVSAMLLGGSAWLIIKAIRDENDHYRIDDEGVCVNDKFVAWESVFEVYADGNRNQRHVTVCIIARHKFSVPITIQPSVTPARYEKLSELLRRDVVVRYPNLKVGEYRATPG